VEGARQGYRAARTELDALPPHAIDSVLAAYRKEGARLAATARSVGLVERALRGETFTPKMPHEGVPTGRPPRGRASTPEMPDEGAPTEQPQPGKPQQGKPQQAPRAAEPQQSTRTGQPRRGNKIKS
jgi:hypothetical protein